MQKGPIQHCADMVPIQGLLQHGSHGKTRGKRVSFLVEPLPVNPQVVPVSCLHGNQNHYSRSGHVSSKSFVSSSHLLFPGTQARLCMRSTPLPFPQTAVNTLYRHQTPAGEFDRWGPRRDSVDVTILYYI